MTTTLILALLTAVVPPTGPTGKVAPPSRQQTTADFWQLEWQLGPVFVPPRGGAPRPSPGLRSLGASLYRQRCASCHGESGKGDGPGAARLDVRPTNFTYGIYKLRSTPFPSLPTDLDLFTTLTRGIHGTPMLPWRQLGEKERWALVAQLKAFSPRFQTERPQASIRVPPPPRETDALRERGKRLYAFMECATCHGEKGAADGPLAKDMRQWASARITPIRDFTRGRFIRGVELTDLFLTLQTGLHGTTMDSYNALLSDEEIWAVAAYVRSLILEHPDRLPPAGTSGTSARSLASRKLGGRPSTDDPALP